MQILHTIATFILPRPNTSFDWRMVYHPHYFSGRIYQRSRLWCCHYTDHTLGPLILLPVYVNNQQFCTI